MTDTPPKPFVERLRDRAARSSKVAGGARNRAKFLSVKSDVEAALAEGWPVSQIWEALVDEGRIDFSYVWFAKFVREAIRKSTANPKAPASIADAPASPPPAPVEPNKAAPVEPPAEPTPEPRPRPKRFHHPDSPKKEDYL